MVENNSGQITIIPDNNQVNFQDINQTITVTDNISNTIIDVIQPTTQVVQVLTGPMGVPGTAGALPTSGSLNLTGSINVSGSVSANNFIGGAFSGSFSGSFTGSLEGTASWAQTALVALSSQTASYVQSSSYAITASYASQAVSSSYALTASYVENAQTASYVLNAISSSFATTASYVQNAQTASYVLNAISASYAITASYADLAQTASYVTTAQTASYVTLAQTASYVTLAQTASYVLNAVSSSYSDTASYLNTLNQNLTVNGNLTLNGTASITYLDVTYESASIIYSSGSNQLGDATDDVQTLIGRTKISGSLEVTGSLNIQDSAAQLSIVGNGFGQASLISPNGALVLTPGLYGVQINGVYPDLKVNGNITTDGYLASNAAGSYLTGSLLGTSSYAINATTASNILGGKATHIPFFITDTTLATSSIFQSGSTSIIINQDANTSANPEALYVWQPSTSSFNVISGKGNLNNYLQLNIQNTNQGVSSSSDVVATANNGNESTNYIDMGINSENFTGSIGVGNDAYLYSTGRHLHIGNTTNNPVIIFAGGFDTDADRKLQIDPNNYHQLTGSLDISENLIVNGSITGSLLGTASYAAQALSSSYALTASYASNVPVTASYALNALSASYAITSSYVENAQTASYVVSSSYATNALSSSYALTASYASNVPLTSSYAISASQAVSSSYALTASYVENAQTASYVENAISSSFATTASYITLAQTASYVTTAQTASYVLNAISSSFATTASYVQNAQTASYVTTAQTASYVLNAISSSFSTTASYALTYTPVFPYTGSAIISGSLTTTGSFRALATSTSFAGYFTNNSFNLSGNNPLIAYDGGPGTIGLGYGTIATDRLWAAAQGLYIGGHGNYGVFFERSGFVSSGKARIGDSNFNTGTTLELIGTGATSATSTLLVQNSSAVNLLKILNDGTVIITGSLSITGGVTGSLLGTASYAVQALSSSYALTASYAANVPTTASYALNALSASFSQTASYVQNAQTASYVQNAQTASYVLNAISSSYSITSSYSSNSDLLDGRDSTTFANTGSNTFLGNQTITGSLFTTGSNTLLGDNTIIGNNTITGSNNILGNSTLSGSITISGNTLITGSITAINQTASFGYVSASFLDITGKQTVKGFTQYLPTSDIVPISTVGGYIYSSGSQGDLYFAQTNGVENNVTRLRWIEGNLYSGLLNGAVITSQSSTIYQVSSGSGIIVSLNGSLSSDPYPTVQYITWPNLSASIAPLSASYDQSFVAIQPTGSAGIIYVQGTPYDDGQFNTLIPIGNVIHQNRSTINATATYPSVGYGYKQRSSDFIRAFGPLKLSGLNTIISGSSTGSLQITSGTSYNEGRNYVNDPNNPSYVIDSGQPISKIFRYYQSGSSWVYLTNGGVGFETIDPTQYSNNGILTAVPGTGINREFTIQRVYYFPGGATKGIYVYYGNATYPTLTDAIANIPFETFTEAPNTAAGAVLSAYIIVRNNADFTIPESYSIRAGGLFRNIGGSGGGGSTITQTLAGLSDVAISGPQNKQSLVYSNISNKWENTYALSGSLIGNASTATSASYASTASYVVQAISSSLAQTASYVTLAQTASYVATAQTASYVLQAVSASFATTASYVQNAQTASYVLNAQTASYVTLAQTASYVLNAQTASYVTTAQTASYVTLAQTASYVATAQTASYVLSSSYAVSSSNASTASYFLEVDPVFVAKSASLATTGSNTFTGNQIINGNITVNGTASITYLDVTYESASVIYSSGSNQFGDATNDTQTLIGRVIVSGSLEVTGSVNIPSITGSLLGTASYASQALTASYVQTAQTASYILQAVSASFATTASYALTASTTTAINGTTNYIPLYTSANTLANSVLIQSASNIGIGTSTARTKLNITNGDISAYNLSGSGVNSIGAQIYLGDSNFESAGYYNSAPGIGAVYSPATTVPGDLALYTYNGFANNRLENMRLFRGGNVGIGTTVTSSYKLDVNGTGRFTGDVNITGSIYTNSTSSNIFDNSAGSNYLRVRRTGGTVEAVLGSTAGGVFVGSSTVHSTNIQTSGVTRISTFSTGNTVIQNGGTFTDAGFLLDVQGTTRFNGNSLITGSLTATSISSSAFNPTNITNNYFPVKSGSALVNSVLYQSVAGETLNWGNNNTPNARTFAITAANYPGVTLYNNANSYTFGMGPAGGFSFTNGANNNVVIALAQNASASISIVDQNISTCFNGGNFSIGHNNIFTIPSKFYVVGNSIMTGSLTVSGSVMVTGGITGSLLGTATTASYVLQAVSSSFATTASYYGGTVETAATASYSTNFTVANTLIIDQTLTDYARVTSTIAGANNLFTQPTGSYRSAFGKYTLFNGTNARSGEFVAVLNDTNVRYTDSSTTDIGDTTDIVFSAAIVGSDLQINADAASSGWTVRMLTTYL